MKTEELTTWLATNEAYHADLTADSHSSLELFRDSRERYEGERITGRIKQKPPTPEMEFGTLCHSFILEHESFYDCYAVCKRTQKKTSTGKVDLRTTEGKEAWKAAEEENPGKVVVDPEDLLKAMAMYDGIMRNREARAAMESEGVNENPVCWTDGPTGMRLKCKPDRALKSGMVVDLKTTDDISPSGFSRTIYNMGHHRQAALYIAGLFASGQECPFLFIAVSRTPPHETACHTLVTRAIDLGTKENRETLRDLSTCRLLGDFTGQWSSSIHEVDLPQYAYSQSR